MLMEAIWRLLQIAKTQVRWRLNTKLQLPAD